MWLNTTASPNIRHQSGSVPRGETRGRAFQTFQRRKRTHRVPVDLRSISGVVLVLAEMRYVLVG